MTKNHYLAVAVLSLMLGLMLRSCLRRTPAGDVPQLSKDLPATDSVRVAVKGNTLEVQTPTKTEYKYVPEEGQAVIDITHQGIPVITVTNKGFTHRFGIDGFMADKLRLGVDCELLYWNRFGTVVVVGVSSNPLLIGFVGVTYQLDQLHLNNTHLLLGYTTKKDIAVGVRVGF